MRVEMLPDDIDDIVSTVHSLKARVGENGAIITSGGIGPTHDDVRSLRSPPPSLACLLVTVPSLPKLQPVSSPRPFQCPS